MGLFSNGLFNTGSSNDDASPRTGNRHTLRAQKLDGKYEKALRRADPARAASLWYRADKAARKGGWS